jgi:heterodisulfide reductase subunit A
MEEEKLRIGVFVCDCGLNIAGTVDTEAVAKYSETLDDVVAVVRNKYTCADPGQNEIKKAIKEHQLNRVVVASCTPKIHEPTFRQCVAEAGLNPYLYEMANIREHCSWVHQDEKEKATEKAMDLVRNAVARARMLEPQLEAEVPVLPWLSVVVWPVSNLRWIWQMPVIRFIWWKRSPVSVGSWPHLIKRTRRWTVPYEFSVLR